MAPSSYQAKTRGDSTDKSTYSQSAQSNLAQADALVGDLLDQKGRNVITIRPGDTVENAVKILADKGIGALVVTDQNGVIAGILSERDIVRRMADTPGQTLPQKVEELMTREVVSCGLQDSMIRVLQQMTEGKFRHMPVIDGIAVVGMVTIGDVVNFRLKELEYEALRMKQMIVG
jgi:CBS domain-containing protein